MLQVFPIGLIILGVLLLLMLFGVTQRVFDKMRLSTLWAVILTVAIGVGGLIPAIAIGNYFTFSIGGFLIPFLICLFLLFSMGWSWDLLRAMVATIVTAGSAFLLYWFVPGDTMGLRIATSVIVGIIAGGVSYLIGRSRRGAFFSAVMGVWIAQIIVFAINMNMGVANTVLTLGVGHFFNTVIIAAVSAMLLAIIIGEIAEHMSTRTRSARNLNYEAGEFYERNELDGRGMDSHNNWAEHNDEYDDFFHDV